MLTHNAPGRQFWLWKDHRCKLKVLQSILQPGRDSGSLRIVIQSELSMSSSGLRRDEDSFAGIEAKDICLARRPHLRCSRGSTAQHDSSILSRSAHCSSHYAGCQIEETSRISGHSHPTAVNAHSVRQLSSPSKIPAVPPLIQPHIGISELLGVLCWRMSTGQMYRKCLWTS